jgi:hypothetical protein
MPQPLQILAKSIDFNVTRDGAQLNLAVAATDSEPAYVLGIPFTADEAAQAGGLLLALAGALKAAPPSPIIAARGLSVVSSNGG